MLSRIKGTQDFLDVTLFNYIVQESKQHLALYNFHEIATPIVEPLELFKRSLGLETDVVTKEMYTVNTGRGEEVIALRPEATASVMRAFLNNAVDTTPWKVFLVGPMFRHERPQKGRLRQFHQINIEIIGSQAIAQDAQFIKMLDRLFYEKLRIREYALALNFLGCAEDRAHYRILLSKFLATVREQICPTCKERAEKNSMRVFDCKSPACQQIFKNAPFIAEHLCAQCTHEWQELRHHLEQLSVSFSYVPTLVRGLDYYGKTVFEFIGLSQLGAQNAFCGGGRYNTLAQELGGKDQPSIGAAIGIERILLMLEPLRDQLPLAHKPPLHVIIPFTHEQHSIALLLADELSAHALRVDVLLEGDSLKGMMRKAHKMGATYALLIGPEELTHRTVTLKNMITGEEKTIAQIDVVTTLT